MLAIAIIALPMLVNVLAVFLMEPKHHNPTWERTNKDWSQCRTPG
jgi:hypothetical protein